jgi:hypothetical protein
MKWKKCEESYERVGYRVKIDSNSQISVPRTSSYQQVALTELSGREQAKLEKGRLHFVFA